MKRLLIAILGAAAVVAAVWSPVSAQEAARLNQDMDNRSNLQSEQTIGGLTSKPGVDVQQPLPAHRSPRRRPARASKGPPHFKIPPPAHRVPAPQA
jgi:hypothetical protein